MQLGYRFSFLIGALCIIIGWMDQLIFGQVQLPVFPINVIVFFVLVNILLIYFYGFRKSGLYKWMVSVPASIGAVSSFSLLLIASGLYPQNEASGAFIDNIKNSWPFLLTGVYLILTLGLTTIRRSIPFKRANIGFIFNHLGLWLVVTAGILGRGDLQRLNLAVKENELSKIAYSNENIYELPFGIYLKDFHIDFYPAKMGVVKNKDLSTEKILIFNNGKVQYADNKFSIKKKSGQGWLIELDNKKIAEVSTNKPDFINLNDKVSLIFYPPGASLFKSDVLINDESFIVKVNQPVSFKGWKIYQNSYELHSDGDISIFEIVKDPWLPIIYSGLVMMILGAIYLLIKGNKKTKDAI